VKDEYSLTSPSFASFNEPYNPVRPAPDLPIGYVGLRPGPQDPRGLQQTVVRIESIAGMISSTIIRQNYML